MKMSNNQEPDNTLICKENDKSLKLNIHLDLQRNNKKVVHVDQSINFESILEPALIGNAIDQLTQTLQLLGTSPFIALLKKYIITEVDNMHNAENDKNTFLEENKTLINTLTDDQQEVLQDDIPSPEITTNGIDLEIESSEKKPDVSDNSKNPPPTTSNVNNKINALKFVR